jgi:orotate phosphoribosyltransferase-like protein
MQAYLDVSKTVLGICIGGLPIATSTDSECKMNVYLVYLVTCVMYGDCTRFLYFTC